jgi:hypothetical protein
LDEIAAASDMRQKIIHGFIISHQEGTGEATMIQLLRGGAPNAHIQFTVTTLDILRAASAAADLGKRSLGIGTLLLGVRAELLDKFNQTRGKIPS